MVCVQNSLACYLNILSFFTNHVLITVCVCVCVSGQCDCFALWAFMYATAQTVPLPEEGGLNSWWHAWNCIKSQKVYIIKHPPTTHFLCFSERLCAFCYCGGRSLLGQGDLQVFTVTSQLEALFSHKADGSSTGDGSDGDKTAQPKKAEETTSGQKEKKT